MKKRIIAFFLSMLFVLSCFPAAVLADSPTDCAFEVEQVMAKPGQTVNVRVSIKNNPGILGATLKVNWDDGLTLTGSENGDVFLTDDKGPYTFTKPGRYRNGCNFVWFATEIADTDICDGVLLTLTFDVADAEEYIGKNLAVKVSYAEDDIFDRGIQSISPRIVNGMVTVQNFVYGDVNDDGNINTTDLIRLCQYIADGGTDPEGYNVSLNALAADVDESGRLNPQDLIYLAQYIADGGTDPEGYNISFPMNKKCIHSMTATAEQAATCTEDGNIAYWYCTNCEKYFRDAAGKTEIALEDTVVKATGHTYAAEWTYDSTYHWHAATCEHTELQADKAVHRYNDNHICEACGAEEIVEKNTYSIQYNIGLGIYHDAEMDVSNASAKQLYIPSAPDASYEFVGYTDVNTGKFYPAGTCIVPAGNTSDLILKAEWLSKRNRAYPKAQLDDPVVVEDLENQRIYFAYDIGTIRNVPLYEITKYENKAGAEITVTVEDTNKIEKSNMESWASTVSKQTTDSSQFELSSEYSDITEVSEKTVNEHGGDRDIVEKQATSQSSTQSIQVSNGGSSERYVYNDAFHSEETNEGYVLNQNFDTGASFELTTGLKNTTELGGGLSFPIDIIDVNLSAKNTTEVSLNTDTKLYADYSVGSTETWDKNTYDESYHAESMTDTKTWNSSAANSFTVDTLNERTVTNSIHEMMSEEYGYGKTYSETKGDKTIRGNAESLTDATESGTAVTYINSDIHTTGETTKFTGTAHGEFRLIATGVMHVIAVVGYDIATQNYFVFNEMIMGDGTQRCGGGTDGTSYMLDYSYDGSFTDWENSVIPFEVPLYVNNYVDNRIARTKGLEFEFNNKNHTAVVDSYHGTDKVVYIPSFIVDENGRSYTVTGITSGAFAGKDIVAISLGRYVSEIPSSAFKNCSALEYIVCPAVTSVGGEAFSGCTSLKEFTISPQVTSLGANAFVGVKSLKVLSGEACFAEAEVIAARAVVMENAAASGAKSITLDLSSFPKGTALDLTVGSETAPAENVVILASPDNKLNYEFKNLAIKAYAKNISLQDLYMSACPSPIRLFADKVTLYATDIENCASYGLLLANPGVELTLSGTNTIIGNAFSMVGSNVKVEYVNSGRLKLTGNLKCLGTVTDDSARISFITSGAVQSITKTEFDGYIKGMYTVTFNANGGSVSTSSKTVTYGSTYGDLPTPTKTGYNFDGWYTAKTGGTKITKDTNVSITEDQTLYAHWTAKKLTVTFNANGGSVSTSSKTVTYASTYGDLPTPTRTGYTFGGWYTEKSGGTKITKDTDVSITAAQTLYAHWTVNAYTYNVVYKSSNGTELGTATVKKNYGTTNTVTPEEFAGYDTPAAQDVKWDSTTAKTITFAYAPTAVKNTTYSAVFKPSQLCTVDYAAEFEYRNRTENSIELRVHWGLHVQDLYYHGFHAQINCGGISKKTVLCDYSYSGRKDETFFKPSEWFTVSLDSADTSSVSVSGRVWQVNANATELTQAGKYYDSTFTCQVNVPKY